MGSPPATRTTAKVVEAIIRDEIGQGEGANLVIGRHYRAVVADWDAAKALTVLRRLMERERGAYWTFCFFTGERFLIGASPERHVSVRKGDVTDEPDLGGHASRRRATRSSTRGLRASRSGCSTSSPTRRRSSSSSWWSTRSSR